RVGETAVDALASPIPGNGVVVSLRDRSVTQRLADDARGSERLASLATVAAGIAHEVKNPLGGIRGAAQLLGRKAPPESREYLDVIVREVDRIAALVDRLRDLSASEISRSREPVDLNRLLHELALLQGTTGEAKIDLDLDPSLPPVDGDADLLRRLFLNLLRNALEAPAKHVRVETRVETGRKWRDPAGHLHALVSAAVEDDGPGVPPESREKLFEPFFTTKASGTGLGLAAALKIAHDHAGTIALEAPVSRTRGARFVVTLPASLPAESAR
ncbi:MAG TPA: ATP-binding protein, partial [Gemmatimonadaceae bacterium]|nr:ATP-binding protein [Gemmatimonadaceae bacterium]